MINLNSQEVKKSRTTHAIKILHSSIFDINCFIQIKTRTNKETQNPTLHSSQTGEKQNRVVFSRNSDLQQPR